MKIAFVTDVIYPYVKGGSEKRVWELAKRLSAAGHEITIYGMKFWEGSNVIEKNGVKLYGISEPLKLYEKEGKRSITQAIYFSIKIIPSLLKNDYDIMDCNQFPILPIFPAKLASIIKRKPLIVTFHEIWSDYWYEYLGTTKGFIAKIIEKLSTKLPDHIIAVSDKTKKDLIKIGVKESEITIIPNGIDFDEIQLIEKSEKKFDVLFAGRLIKDKNIDILIKAIKLAKKELPEIKLGIIGDGPERFKLETLAKNLDLEQNVEFLDFIENYDDFIAIMKSSKIFVLPSTREGFGITALEANACGLPVIAVKHEQSAVNEIVKDGINGFLVNLSDEDIEEKILEILKNETLREKMSKNSVEIARRYDWNNIIIPLEKLYTKILENN